MANKRKRRAPRQEPKQVAPAPNPVRILQDRDLPGGPYTVCPVCKSVVGALVEEKRLRFHNWTDKNGMERGLCKGATIEIWFAENARQCKSMGGRPHWGKPNPLRDEIKATQLIQEKQNRLSRTDRDDEEEPDWLLTHGEVKKLEKAKSASSGKKVKAKKAVTAKKRKSKKKKRGTVLVVYTGAFESNRRRH